MPRKKLNTKPTHRAVLASGETVDYFGAHPTHWTFGGVNEKGEADGSPVRTVPVLSVHPLRAFPDYTPPEDDEDEE